MEPSPMTDGSKKPMSNRVKVYAKEVFLPHISLQLCKATRVDLVWDVYLIDSLKDTPRNIGNSWELAELS